MTPGDPALLQRTTHRVRLRRLASSDLPAFQAYRRDPAVGLYQGWTAQSDEDAERFLTTMSAVPLFGRGAWTQLGIADVHSDVLIGDIGVFVAGDGTHAEIGFSLSAQWQGRGLATHAVDTALGLVFASSGVPRVIAVTDDRNSACLRLLERIGMTKVLTAPAQFRGAPCIEHTLEITAVQHERGRSRAAAT